MRRKHLPQGGLNVFQLIRAKRAEAEAQGIDLLDLSIGEPKGAAFLSARESARDAIMSESEAMHAYQYNASPGVPDFPRRFVAAHLHEPLRDNTLEYLPIPGIKPMLGLLPLACGCAAARLGVATMTRPGYPIPADWCAYHPHVVHAALPLTVDNAFRFAPTDIPIDTGLVMMNYPHNPSGQIATPEWLHALCEYCAVHDIRLFNDAAYVVLTHTQDGSTLSEVAQDFPDLSWAEAFTAAKLIGNGTGWHVGAMVGSPDFITDVAEVKGKTDTGHVAPMAAGAIACVEQDRASIDSLRRGYAQRLQRLGALMAEQGMRLALKPQAGFYTLWQTPTHAFGIPVKSAADFNFQMIENTGVVGVHFGDYVRYAVCADIDTMAESLTTAFAQAQIAYE